jgi:hypothetical protein
VEVGKTALAQPDHVAVHYLDMGARVPGADMHRPSGRDERVEVSHDGGDTTARRFITDSTGTTHGPDDTPEAADSGADQSPSPQGSTEAAGAATAQAEADTQGETKTVQIKQAMSSTLRATGRLISDAAGAARDAYREGPGERMIEAELERRAERFARGEVTRVARQAKRDAPLGQKRFASNNVRYFDRPAIMREAKARYKSAIRAGWSVMEAEQYAAQGGQDEKEDV